VKYLLSALGSAGDLHPMMGIATTLAERGHDVALLATPYFAETIRKAGLEHIPLGTAEEFESLTAHPDLAGKLAAAGQLTAESTSEQAGAGLDLLTDDERETFQKLNAAYMEKHGFPFIIAVRDHDKASILSAFHRRIDNDRVTEFAEACRQVERIAELRLIEKLG